MCDTANSAHVGTPDLQRHDRLCAPRLDRPPRTARGRRRRPRCAGRSPSSRRRRRGSRGPRRSPTSAALPRPTPIRRPKPLTVREEAHREVHASAARDDRRGPGFEPGHVGHEVGHHAVDQVHEAGGVRTEHSDAVPVRRSASASVLQDPTLRRLGEATRADDRGPHAAGTAVLERRGHRLGRHDEHREVDGPADRRDRGRDRAALDLGRPGVDEMEDARKARAATAPSRCRPCPLQRSRRPRRSTSGSRQRPQRAQSSSGTDDFRPGVEMMAVMALVLVVVEQQLRARGRRGSHATPSGCGCRCRSRCRTR